MITYWAMLQTLADICPKWYDPFLMYCRGWFRKMIYQGLCVSHIIFRTTYLCKSTNKSIQHNTKKRWYTWKQTYKYIHICLLVHILYIQHTKTDFNQKNHHPNDKKASRKEVHINWRTFRFLQFQLILSFFPWIMTSTLDINRVHQIQDRSWGLMKPWLQNKYCSKLSWVRAICTYCLYRWICN